MSGQAVVGVFDAGIGGVPLAALLDRAGHRVVYLADSARRPYGPQPNEAVAGYVAQAERFFAEAGCDVWAIACNTASVVAAEALQGLIPCVDMVSAVVDEFPSTGSGPVGLLATAGTISSGAFPRALPTYDVHQVATEKLLRLAEEGGDDHDRVRFLASVALSTLRDHGCTTAILACTDFTCVMDDLECVAGGMRLFDPLAAAERLIEKTLEEARVSPRRRDVGSRLVLTGPHQVDVRAFAQERFGLELPEPEYLSISGTSPL